MFALITALVFAQVLPSHESSWVGVDQLLAGEFRDPTSVIQYAITPPFTCPGERDQSAFSCICWRANGKNARGAYAGKQEFRGRVYPMGAARVVIGDGRLKAPDEVFMCSNAGYVERDGARIAAQAK